MSRKIVLKKNIAWLIILWKPFSFLFSAKPYKEKCFAGK